MTELLCATDLGRWYGQVVGLNDLTVAVGAGITGLVGPNGAGKSTFLKLVTGEIRPSRGRVEVFGQTPFGNRSLFRRIGFCPQQDALYNAMSARTMVRFLLRLSGFGRRDAVLKAEAALERVDLTAEADRRVGTYSKGMRQRVKLAQAIAHEPELLILDEPLTGLDPIGRRDVIQLLRELSSSGMHIVVSSHVLHEIESVTDNIVLLHHGRLVAKGSVREVRRLLSQHPRRVEIQAREARSLACALLTLDHVLAVRLASSTSEQNGQVAGSEEPAQEPRMTIETSDLEALQRSLTGLVAEHGFGITQLETVDENLEAVFDYLVGSS